jgi:hypothetical protein
VAAEHARRIETRRAGFDEAHRRLTARLRMRPPISLYQVVEWATAHIIRYNQQAKRVLGR